MKPENVVVSPEWEVTLIDFGLADFSSNCSKAFAGTLPYLAPEMIEGRPDHRCDIWSVGVVAYYMLTGGKLPFRGKSREDVVISILGAPLLFPEHRKIGWFARNLVRCLLERDPRKRIDISSALRHPFLRMYTDSEEAIADSPTEKESSSSPVRKVRRVG